MRRKAYSNKDRIKKIKRAASLQAIQELEAMCIQELRLLMAKRKQLMEMER